jgi:hypothetical protein
MQVSRNYSKEVFFIKMKTTDDKSIIAESVPPAISINFTLYTVLP